MALNCRRVRDILAPDKAQLRGQEFMQSARFASSAHQSRHRALLGLVMLSAVSVMEPAAGEQASGLIGVHTTVPIICRVKTEAPFSQPLRAGSNDLGHADAYCNAYRGYRLTLEHGNVPAGTRLLVDSRPVALAAGTTETLLEEGDRPLYHEKRHMELVLPEDGDPHLVLRLVMNPRS